MSEWITRIRLPIPCLPKTFPATQTRGNECWVAADIELSGGKLVALHPPDTWRPSRGLQVWDGQDRLLLPGFVDAHVHLDKTHTWDRSPNNSGTFGEAIEAMRADKIHWTEEDVYNRAAYALKTAEAYGTIAIRTHLDTDPDQSEPSYRALRALAKEWAGRIEIQFVSLCGVEDYLDPAKGNAIADLVQNHGGTGLGGMPIMNPLLDEQLDALLGIAADRQLPVDLHVDESGDPGAQTLKAVARAVIRNQFDQQITCGHCCSLSILPEKDREETLRLVAEADIGILALPLCNQYLQGRLLQTDGSAATPQWRGLTLLHEMAQRGIRIGGASDNVRDAFFAYGDYDMMEVWLSLLRHGHMDLRAELSLQMVTAYPAEFMGLHGTGTFRIGEKLSGTLFSARTFSELWSRRQPSRWLARGSELLDSHVPEYPA